MGSLLGGGNGLLGRGGRELGGLGLLGLGDDGGSGRSRAATDHVLDLAGVVASVLLTEGGKLIGLLLGGVADLGGLGVDGIGSGLEVLIDELLVGSVDEGNEEGESGAEDGKAPVGNELDEEVGEESSNAGLEGLLALEMGRGVVRGAVRRCSWDLQQQRHRCSQQRECADPR